MTQGSIDANLAARASSLNVGGLFRFRAQYFGDRIALENDERRYSYAELNERVNRLANVLAGLGVVRGERVAVLSENRTEYIELQLAAAKLGAIVAAQNWRLAPAELEHCLRLVEPHTLVVSERFVGQAEAVPHGAQQVLCFGEDYEARLAAADASEPADVAEPEDGLIILYTSGTTGLPKGALISHRAMIARGQIGYLDRAAMGRAVSQDDAFVAWAPLFHMVSTDMATATLINGGKVIVVDGFDPERLAEITGTESIGWLTLMPGMIGPFIDAMRRKNITPKGVKTAGCMADLVPRHQIAELTELLQAPYVNSFGSSETGSPPASKDMIEVGVVAQSLPKQQSSYCQIRLLDEEGNEVPDGEPGELVFRGPTLFSGYWNAPETNARDFQGGWFHMGDVFVRQPDGRLNFVDRRKYLIKSGGENIYPAEIEQVLLADERIAEAVVIRQPDEKWGEIPVAFVVAHDESLTAESVVACCDGKIARYKLPRAVHFVTDDDLPRSSTGKIKRYLLEERLNAQPESAQRSSAQRSNAQQQGA